MKIDSKEKALAVLNYLQTLKDNPPPKFIDDNFVKQARFIRDKANRKSALCTRRAGKSYGIGLELFHNAFETPGSTCLYLGLTRDSARKIMWKDVMRQIDRRFKLGCKPNESLLSYTLPNESEIYLAGADKDMGEMEKYLGGKLKKVIVDEAGSFKIDLEKLIYENLEPALADYGGSTSLVGTPTALTKSFFYKVTTGNELGWSNHSWNTFDNPYMLENWKKQVNRLIETNPRVVDTPWYKRMYLGEWVTDLDDLVYKYDATKNRISSLPSGQYSYVLGVDLGFDDDSAFVVCAYSDIDRNLYIIDAYKKAEMIISDVAERIRYYHAKYPIFKTIIDNAAKQSVEELKQRFTLDLTAAEKSGKAEFIEIMNSEFIQGTIKLTDQSAEVLEDEYENLIWDEKASKRQEHPNCANHAADAALYAWRHTYSYMARPVDNRKPNDEDIIEDYWNKESQRIMDQSFIPFWERDYDS